MKTFTITGSSGFVGQNLIQYFTDSSLGTTYSISLRETLPTYLAPADAIIHLAGKAHDLENASNPEVYFDVNYAKTKDLFDLFLNSEIRDFIFFSSVKAAADIVDEVLVEKMIAKPETPYGQSKQFAEQYLLGKELPTGKRLFILRPCMIHGPGNKGNLNLLYKIVKKGIPYPLGAFDNKRSFLSIDNLLFIIERILKDSSIPSGIYNIADDEPLSTKEVIKIIGKASNSKTHIWDISKSLINFIAIVGDKTYLPLNSERLKKLTESYVVSNQKIKNALKIQSLPVSAQEGLIKTIKSFEYSNNTAKN